MKVGKRSELKKFDFSLFTLALILSIFGLIMISSATRSGVRGFEWTFFFYRQLIWIILSIVIFMLVSFYDVRKLINYSWLFYTLNLILLVAVVFFGEETLGAQRWIQIGPVNIQPSEFAKLFMMLFFASYFANLEGEITLKDIGVAFAYLLLPVFLIFIQPDLGTAAVLVVMLIGMIIASGAKVRDIVIVCLIILLAFAGAVKFGLLKEYQIKRLVVFLNPETDPTQAGYNLTQAKIAIGSGGIKGKGLFAGTQTSLRFVPEKHTDFIFSVVGEETGFIGALLLLTLYFLLLLRIEFVAYSIHDEFLKYFIFGYIVILLFHILTNIGMNMGIMPITGIPLPFISSGGSFLLMNWIALGIISSAWRNRLS